MFRSYTHTTVFPMTVSDTDQPAVAQYVDDAAKKFLATLLPDDSLLFHATKAAQSLLDEIETANNKDKDNSTSRTVLGW